MIWIYSKCCLQPLYVLICTSPASEERHQEHINSIKNFSNEERLVLNLQTLFWRLRKWYDRNSQTLGGLRQGNDYSNIPTKNKTKYWRSHNRMFLFATLWRHTGQVLASFSKQTADLDKIIDEKIIVKKKSKSFQEQNNTFDSFETFFLWMKTLNYNAAKNSNNNISSLKNDTQMNDHSMNCKFKDALKGNVFYWRQKRLSCLLIFFSLLSLYLQIVLISL